MSPSARLNISYYDAMLPLGLDESRLVMARWDEARDKWIVLEGVSVDSAGNRVKCRITRDGTYAVLVPVAPPRFSLSSFQIFPTKAASGEMVSVQCRVTNTGSVTGYTSLTLKLNDNTQEVRRLVLDAGASYVVAFAVVLNTPGTYAVDLDGQKGAFQVSSDDYSSSYTPPESPVSYPEVKPVYWIQLVVSAVIGFFVLILLWFYRRRDGGR